MQLSRLFVMSMLLGSALVACGDDGGKGGGVDAPKAIDAAIDAPVAAGPTGLGKKCTTPADCPANAPECVGLSQTTNAWCTPKCLTGGAGTTNGNGALPLSGVTPAPSTTVCPAAFTGTPVTGGNPVCALILATVPADNPLVANKAYTGIDLGCVVACGTGNTCPMGMTCNTAVGGACLPN